MTLFKSALIVEDESYLAETLGMSLKKFGIESIFFATTLSEAREQVEKPVDLILLDRMLPDGDGLELCLELRQKDYLGAILVLTANGLVDEKIKGLDAGADDYLAKPFSWPELAARLRAVERRLNKKIPKNENVSLWAHEQERLRVWGPKGWVALTPLEFKLFLKFLEKENQIISRDELLKDVWGFQWLPKTRTVDFFMGRLRKYFEPNLAEPRYFLNVRGAGYLFSKDGNAEMLSKEKLP